MNPKFTVKIITICFVLFLAPALFASDPFDGFWLSNPTGNMTNLETREKTFVLNMYGRNYKFTGSYKVEGGKLHYTAADGKDFTDGTPLKGKKGICKILKLNDNLSFQEELKCTGPLEKFRLFGKNLQGGTVRKVNGIEVLTIDAGGQTRKRTVLHSAPNASSKSLSCTLWDQNGKKEFEGKSLKSGVYLRVIAMMKENQDRENAWYYVDASAVHENSCGPGWVQEEFLSIAHGGG